jgi:hypothetical protein
MVSMHGTFCRTEIVALLNAQLLSLQHTVGQHSSVRQGMSRNPDSTLALSAGTPTQLDGGGKDLRRRWAARPQVAHLPLPHQGANCNRQLHARFCACASVQLTEKIFCRPCRAACASTSCPCTRRRRSANRSLGCLYAVMPADTQFRVHHKAAYGQVLAGISLSTSHLAHV